MRQLHVPTVTNHRCLPLAAGLLPILLLGLVLRPTVARVTPGGGDGPAADAIDYDRDIRPILAANCFACHGPDEGHRKAKLRLDQRDDAVRDRDGHAVIAPGKPDDSELIARVRSDEPTEVMPPPESGQTLSDTQKDLLERWIQGGAGYTEHWSFRPPVAAAPPAVPAAWAGRVKNPIDAFVFAKVAAAGLEPEPEADRPTLARRAALDLTGLPPDPAVLAAYLADPAADAFERYVDRLLESPRYGEHWARLWLDLARYADTKGYEKDQPRQIWRYRDWVIDAYNADVPFDRFTVEQLAGDLLPDATEAQRLATAFHRNTMTNDEGGTDDEEFRVAAVKDRIDTTMQVWMGLTFGCAKCHSHKYDPISHRDYYSVFAVFNQTEDADRSDDSPTAPMPSPDQRRRIAALEEQVRPLKAELAAASPSLDAKQRAWELSIAGASPWSTPTATRATATGGATLTTRSDGALIAGGPHPDTVTYTVELPVSGPITALRLEALKDPSLPNGGPGRNAGDQNAVVSEVQVGWLAADAAPDARPEPIALDTPRADFEQGGYPVAKAVDGDLNSGWAWSPKNAEPHVALFPLKAALAHRDGRLVVTLVQNYTKLSLGAFRLSTTTATPADLKPELRTLAELAALPVAARSGADAARLTETFRRQYGPTAALYAQLDAAEVALKAERAAIPNTPIVRELPADRRRVTKIHQRGNFLDPGDEVSAAVPATFGGLPEGVAPDRLGAARWLVSPANPLTPRVAVNRIWARLFGIGLVETEEDFGAQGAAPSHPELLDWLAVAFRDTHGWSQKALLKQIVTSATYRQGSRQDPAKVAADPRNRLLARSPRFRLPAEVIRDQALAASGLLSDRMHGPSVMPPQPDGLWRAAYSSLKWETSPGQDRHRRGLYTFWRRTSPYPAMTTFDAGSGEVCTIRRIRTNTPLQALVTLNDPAFVEAAGALGRRVLAGPEATVRDRAARALGLVLVRPASAVESDRVVALYQDALADYQADPAAAADLLRSASLTPAAGEPVAELAAWTVVGNVLLNLDETLTRP